MHIRTDFNNFLVFKTAFISINELQLQFINTNKSSLKSLNNHFWIAYNVHLRNRQTHKIKCIKNNIPFMDDFLTKMAILDLRSHNMKKTCFNKKPVGSPCVPKAFYRIIDGCKRITS